MLSRAVLFFTQLAVAAAFLERASLEAIPEKFKNQRGCYIKELDKVVPVGSTTPGTERCVEYRCFENFVSISGCGAKAIRHPCYLVTDESKPYPDCCPKMVCPNK